MARKAKSTSAPKGFTPGQRLERETISLEKGDSVTVTFEARRAGEGPNGTFDLVECENAGTPSVLFLKTDSIRLMDGFDPPPARGDFLWIKRGEDKGRMHTFEMAIKRVASENDQPY